MILIGLFFNSTDVWLVYLSCALLFIALWKQIGAQTRPRRPAPLKTSFVRMVCSENRSFEMWQPFQMEHSTKNLYLNDICFNDAVNHGKWIEKGSMHRWYWLILEWSINLKTNTTAPTLVPPELLFAGIPCVKEGKAGSNEGLQSVHAMHFWVSVPHSIAWNSTFIDSYAYARYGAGENPSQFCEPVNRILWEHSRRYCAPLLWNIRHLHYSANSEMMQR